MQEMKCCNACLKKENSLEELLKEACFLETQLKRTKFEIKIHEDIQDYNKKLLRNVIIALKSYGMFRKIDIFMLRNNFGSIVEWEKEFILEGSNEN